MPSKEVETFTLRDAQGEDHRYVCALHNGDEGLAIVLPLVASAVGPLARILADAKDLGALIDALKTQAEPNGNAPGLVVPWERIAADVRLAILDPQTNAHGLIRDLLKNTTRDGKALRDKHEFDAAFRANYGELFALVGRVIKVNGFLSLAGIFGQ